MKNSSRWACKSFQFCTTASRSACMQYYVKLRNIRKELRTVWWGWSWQGWDIMHAIHHVPCFYQQEQTHHWPTRRHMVLHDLQVDTCGTSCWSIIIPHLEVSDNGTSSSVTPTNGAICKCPSPELYLCQQILAPVHETGVLEPVNPHLNVADIVPCINIILFVF